jgi:hypothetical protein
MVERLGQTVALKHACEGLSQAMRQPAKSASRYSMIPIRSLSLRFYEIQSKLFETF